MHAFAKLLLTVFYCFGMSLCFSKITALFEATLMFNYGF